MDNIRINKYANCSHCSQLYSIREPLRPRGMRCPLVLPCGHSVCEQCVKNSLHNSESVVCAVCGSKAPLSQSDLMKNDIPINLYLLGCCVGNISAKRRVDSKIVFQPAGMSTQLTRKEKLSGTLEMCSECTTSPAVCSCPQCGVLYCNSCYIKVHKAAKALQKHTRLSIGAGGFNPAFTQSKCDVHTEQRKEYYCNECDIVMCPMCTIAGHTKHSIVTVQERNEIILPEVKEAYEKANNVFKRLMKTQKDVKNAAVVSDSSKKRLPSDDLSQTQHAVARHFVNLHGVLQLLEMSLLTQLDQASSGTAQNLMHISQEVDSHIENVKTILDESAKVCDPSNLQRSNLMEVLQKLQAVQKLPCHLLTVESVDDPQIKFSVDEDLVKQLKEHCHLEVPEPKKYILVPTEELPEDYKLESIEESLPELSSGSRTSSLSALSDTGLSDANFVTNSSQLVHTMPPAKGCTEIVTVCHIKNPSNFYVLLESKKDQLNTLTKQLHQYVSRGARPPAVVLQDGLYVVQFNADKNWYRARVKKIISSPAVPEEDKIEVFYIDYGNTETVNSSRLRCINPKHTLIPPFANHCGLFGIAPKGDNWSHEAIKTMAQMLDGWRVIMTVMGHHGGMYLVDLSHYPGDEDSDVPLSVRDAMIFLELGCFRDSSPSLLQNTPIDKQYLEPETFKKGMVYEIVVSHIDSPGSFYVQKLGSHALYLTSVMEDMNRAYSIAGERGMIYTPKIGMPCAAQYSVDKKWYRAKVMKLPGQKKVEVFYVDFGNREILHWTKLRKLKERFLRIAPQAVSCTLSDVIPKEGNVWSDRAKQGFSEIAAKKLLILFVEEILKTHCRVLLYDSQSTVDICLNALLVRNGHAISTGSSSVLVEYPKTEDRVLAGSTKVSGKETISKGLVALPKRSSKKRKAKQYPSQSSTSESSTSSYLPKPVVIMPQATETDCHAQPEPEGEDHLFRLEVTVLSAVNPSCLYVSLNSQQDLMDSLMSELQTFYNSCKYQQDTSQPWSINDKCCVFSEKEHRWFRGIIADIKDDFIKVFLKDFAILETVPVTFIRPLAPQFMEIRDGAVKCHLAGIKAAGDKPEWPTLACEQLTEIVNRYDSLFISKKGEIQNFSLPVELWVKDIIPGGPLEPSIESWCTVNRKLVDQGLAIPIRGEIDSENVPVSQVIKELQDQNQDTGPAPLSQYAASEKKLEPKEKESSLDSSDGGSEAEDAERDGEANTGEVLSEWLSPEPITKRKFSAIPTYVDDDCFIYLHETVGEETLKVVQRALQCRLQNSQPKPHDLYWFTGQLCIAQYLDKNWYRGKVIKVNDDHTVKVLFVDYGNVEDLKATEMRKSLYMGHIPIQCHKYKLDGISPVAGTGRWPTAVLDFVHSTIVEKKCKITVKSIPSDGTPPLISVTAPGYLDLAALLVNMQYARYINNTLQIKAALEPPMFKVKVSNVVSDSDDSMIIIHDDNNEEENGDKEVEEEDEGEIPLEESSDFHKEGKEVTPGVMEESKLESNVELKDCEINNEEEETAGIHDNDEVVIESEMEGTIKREICEQIPIDISATETDSEEDKSKKISSKKNDSIEVRVEVREDGESHTCENPVSEKTKTETEDTLGERGMMEIHVEEEIVPLSDREEDKVDTREEEIEKYNFLAIEKDTRLWADCLSTDESEQDGTLEGEEYQRYTSLDLNCDDILVEVSAIISPNEVIIRPVECEDNIPLIKDFVLMSAKMQEEAKFQPLIAASYIGQPCCVCYKEDGQWYRAAILAIDTENTELRIQYVDYGNVEVVDSEEVHQLKPEWVKVPVQGIPCQLWGVTAPADFDPRDLLTRMTDCLFQPPLKAVIKARDPMLSVELYSDNSSTPVYQPLVDSGILDQAKV